MKGFFHKSYKKKKRREEASRAHLLSCMHLLYNLLEKCYSICTATTTTTTQIYWSFNIHKQINKSTMISLEPKEPNIIIYKFAWYYKPHVISNVFHDWCARFDSESTSEIKSLALIISHINSNTNNAMTMEHSRRNRTETNQCLARLESPPVCLINGHCINVNKYRTFQALIGRCITSLANTYFKDK